MSKIILNRKSEWVNRARGYKVLIDGEEKGAIKNGNSDEFMVPAGSHTVECKLSWCKSNIYNITVTEGEVKYLHVKSGMRYYTPVYVLLMIFILSPFITNKTEFGITPWYETLRAALLILIALYFVYYLTLGRHKYLVLEEDKDSVFQSKQ